ncbi:MAG: type II toxin-antitoxin system RelE/ParE family toxin [Thermoplasmata archaeon]
MTVLWSPQSRKELSKLSKEERDRIIDKVVEFEEKSRGDIKKIAEGLWRLRVGNYRIYYHQKEVKIYVLRVIHRSVAYRDNLLDSLRDEIKRF